MNCLFTEATDSKALDSRYRYEYPDLILTFVGFTVIAQRFIICLETFRML